MDRPSFVVIYMRLALHISDRSTCKRMNTGCVITSADFEQVYALGYNGTAKGFPHECREDEPGNCGDVHAEVNALAKIGVRDKEKMFFITEIPCETCAKLIVNSGASKVYIASATYRNQVGLEVLARAGIKVIQL